MADTKVSAIIFLPDLLPSLLYGKGRKINKFIEDNNVLIEWNGQGISNVKIFYNSNYKKWQLTLEGKHKSNYGFGSCDVHYWSSTAKSSKEMIEWLDTIL